MKRKFLKMGALMCLSASLMFTACGDAQNENDPKELAEESNEAKFDTRAGEKNAELMVDAVAASNMEVSLAQLAMQRSSNAEVKELAAALESDHTAMANELKALAETKAITVPGDLSEKAREKEEDLSEVKAEDFDKKWTGKIVEKHEKSIEKFQSAIDSEDTDPEIRQWMQTTLPKLQAHHEKAKMLHDKLK